MKKSVLHSCLRLHLYINWNEPQATTYIIQAASNTAWVQAGGCKHSLPRYPQGQSRTYYQEYGCHLKKNKERKTFWQSGNFLVPYFHNAFSHHWA